MSRMKHCVSFLVQDLLKTSRPGKPPKRVVCYAFPENTSLCVVTTLNEYLKRTKPFRFWRKEEGADRLFLSFRRPYKPVQASTLARWIKMVLVRSGVEGYTAHSTRGAATSAAANRLEVRDILETADWARETTFNKFYRRAVSPTERFAKAVLK